MRSTSVNNFLLGLSAVVLCQVQIGSALVTGRSVTAIEEIQPVVTIGDSYNATERNETVESITRSTTPSTSESISSSSSALASMASERRSSTSTQSRNSPSSTLAEEPDHMNSIESSPLVMNYTVEKQLRIEAIKRDILNRLGMRRPPDVSRVNMTVQERRQILRLYKKSMEELHGNTASSLLFADDQFYANQFHSFTEAGAKPASVSDGQWRSGRGKRIFLSVDIAEPADPRKETIVKSATLKLFKSEVRPQNLAISDIIDRSLRIEIYQILLEAPGRLMRRSLDSRLVSLDNAGWEEFDVSRAVQDWIRDPSSNLGLEIACDSRYIMDNLLEFVLWSPAVVDNPYRTSILPVLNVLTQEKRILGRQKRNLPERSNCIRGDSEVRCCRFPLTIRFRDIDWDNWVIEPQSYQSYYCSGSCPVNYRTAHRYTRIKNIVSAQQPSIPLNVACTERRMGSVNIAHYNDQNVLVVSVFDNMFPLECMCS